MTTPEIILVVLWAMELCATAYLHGTEKDGKYNFFAKLLSIIVAFFFLKWAGLF